MYAGCVPDQANRIVRNSRAFISGVVRFRTQLTVREQRGPDVGTGREKKWGGPSRSREAAAPRSIE
jgi:hypothetical protein